MGNHVGVALDPLGTGQILFADDAALKVHVHFEDDEDTRHLAQITIWDDRSRIEILGPVEHLMPVIRNALVMLETRLAER